MGEVQKGDPMALSHEDREAFINAALALFRETGRTQSLYQQQAADLQSVPDGTARKTLAINRQLYEVFCRIQRASGTRAIRFRGKLFVLTVDDKAQMSGVTIVEDGQIETIDS